MSKPKHTPGPWALESWRDEHYSLIGDGKVLLGRLSQHLTDAPGFIDAKANATLIAAAPELLEALERILEHVPKYSASTFDPGTQTAFTLAAQTVAKAKGGAR